MASTKSELSTKLLTFKLSFLTFELSLKKNNLHHQSCFNPETYLVLITYTILV